MDTFRRSISFLVISFVLFTIFSVVLNGILAPYDGLLPEMRPMGTLRAAVNDYFEVGFGSLLALVFAGTLSAGVALLLDPVPSNRA